MADESFLLVSLKEDKSRKLAQVISNETCRKILDYLSQTKDSTETEISKALELPISTVHYNLQQLVAVDLVKAKEFHYSEKGKEVNHYSLSNKFIIIAQKPADKLMNKLRRILPVAVIVSATAIGLHFLTRTTAKATLAASQAGAKDVVPVLARAPGVVASEAVNQAQNQAVTVSQTSLALWFLYGAFFTILIFLILDLIHKNNK